MAEKTKTEKFVEEYGELVKKYNVDFANYPLWVPDNGGGFRMVIQTTPVDMEQLQKDKDFIKK